MYKNYKIWVFTYWGCWKFDFHRDLFNCFFYSHPICLLTSPHRLNEFFLLAHLDTKDYQQLVQIAGRCRLITCRGHYPTERNYMCVKSLIDRTKPNQSAWRIIALHRETTFCKRIRTSLYRSSLSGEGCIRLMTVYKLLAYKVNISLLT